MPVVKKRGALFAVYHDSPDKASSPSAANVGAAGKSQSHTQKKHVLSGRSPTTRSKTKTAAGGKGGISSVKPSQAAVAASAALQSHTGTGSSGASRKALGQLSAHSGNALGGRKADGGLGVKEGKDKENVRGMGMGMEPGKSAGKLQVLVDDGMEGVPVKPLESRLRSRRALGDKVKSGVQPQASTLPPRDRKTPSAVASFTVFQDPTPESIGQENIPPPGADPETNPPPAIRRSTRKTTSLTSVSFPSVETRPQASSRHDSGIEDPESPYISKPRLRKMKPTVLEGARAVEVSRNSMASSSQSQSQSTSLVLASSQPYSGALETLDSSPLIARPQTRKTSAATSSSGKQRPTRHPVSAFSVQPDSVLCDVSEAYGADTSLQPGDFGQGSGQSRSTRKVAVRRDTEGTRSGLRPSTYGWTQVSAGEYQAPKPPAPRTKRQSRTKW